MIFLLWTLWGRGQGLEMGGMRVWEKSTESNIEWIINMSRFYIIFVLLYIY